MLVDDFDFNLPEQLIALRPHPIRDEARQLVVKAGQAFHDNTVLNLADHLNSGDILVFNDTRVIPAQLKAIKGLSKFSITLHKRVQATCWDTFIKNSRRLKEGDILDFSDQLSASVDKKGDNGEHRLTFHVKPDQNLLGASSLDSLIAEIGVMPIPPYIASKRKIDERDAQDYQTMFAKREGAVAAPTASLHFTDRLLGKLKAKGVKTVTLTLHVGAGTFLPVKAEDTADHKMHTEWGEITPDAAKTLNDAKAAGGRIVAVGTTTLRLIESAADANGVVHPFCGDTAIFITPGYRFKAIDILMTNFHLPKSTLFMLVCAFCGTEAMKKAYAHAIDNQYRFYSYGDSSLLFRL